MTLPELSIKRPVFATVMSLVLVLVGLVSYDRLSRARISGHRPAGGHRADDLSRRQRGHRRDPGHQGARGLAVRHRGHRLHHLDQPAGIEPDHRALQARPRSRLCRRRCARPGRARARPAAGRDRGADHPEGRGRRPADPPSRLLQRPALGARDHRLCRPLRQGSAPDASRRCRGASVRRARIFHAHLARSRSGSPPTS